MRYLAATLPALFLLSLPHSSEGARGVSHGTFIALGVAAVSSARVKTLNARSIRHAVFGNNHSSKQPEECLSAAQRWILHSQKEFKGILKRGNVQISDSGVITLPKLNNIIPFDGIEKPAAVLGGNGSAVAAYKPQMKQSTLVTGALNDLKKLLAIVGIKTMHVVGLAGGRSYGPGGSHYKEEWRDGWIKVAEARAKAIIKALGLQDRSGLTPEGSFGTTIGVDISIVGLLKITALKSGVEASHDCAEYSEQEVLTPELMVVKAKEILSRQRIKLTVDEKIEFTEPVFVNNVIPFKRCTGIAGVSKAKRLEECISEVAIDNDKNQKQLLIDAMQDIVDLSNIADVTRLQIIGYSQPGKVDTIEAGNAQKLGAARARLLVELLQGIASSSPLTNFLRPLHDSMSACVGSIGAQINESCDPVSKFGKIAVEIQMETLVNPAALMA